MPAKMNHYDAAIRVCVDEVGEGRVRGYLTSRRLTAPVPFADLGSLVLQVEEILNRQHFPQAFERTRTFFPDEPGQLPVAEDLDSGLTREEVDAAHGRVDTFLLYVITRRNTTWQGFVDWLDGTRSDYSSALELLRLVDRRLADRAAPAV